MNNNIAVVLFSAFLSFSVPTPGSEATAPSGAKDPPSVNTDLEKLQGTWFHFSREVGGKAVAGQDKESLVVVRGNVVVFKRGTEVSQVGTIKLVATTGNPKKMDLIITDGPNEGKTVLAIYEVGKEMFQYCGGLDERPTSFATKKDDKSYTYCSTYKRLKR